MTTIRQCFVGDRPCNGLVTDDGTIVALIVDTSLIALLGFKPSTWRWERYRMCAVKGTQLSRVICVRYNGRDYDLADTPNIAEADEQFAKHGWQGDENFVLSLEEVR